MIRISEIPIQLNQDIAILKALAARILGVNISDIPRLDIVKKSLDARKKTNIHFKYTVDAAVLDDEEAIVKKCPYVNVSMAHPYVYSPPPHRVLKRRPIIVGSGPAGLFCALILSRYGAAPIIVERGKPVEQRQADINLFFENSTLNEHSNIQFGEGGAGTFSDGKLTTNIKDPLTKKVLTELVEAGAPPEILYESKPHIGTDKLGQIMKSIRGKIENAGGEFRFSTLFQSFTAKDGKICSCKLKDIESGQTSEIETDTCILAIGHSARETFEMLFTKKLMMEPKPFAIGTRIEHSQKMINRAQYGALSGSKLLGAAEYKLAISTFDKRGCYTFCMCPGGTVVAASSEHNSIAVNGMSNYNRDGANANSALLVGIRPDDFGDAHPLSGIYFQRSIEKSAFAYSGSYRAPAQLVGDFLANRESKSHRSIIPSYPCGLAFGKIDCCLPPYVTTVMRTAITEMNRKLEGFSHPDAVLTACETRSSSPVRILRDITMQSNIRGIYPCGEGAGYAGGIMSSAVDGIKCAENILNQ